MSDAIKIAETAERYARSSASPEEGVYPEDRWEWAVATTIRAQAAEIERLREALLFYSDPKGDGYDVLVTDYVSWSKDPGAIIRDSGFRARKALEDTQ